MPAEFYFDTSHIPLKDNTTLDITKSLSPKLEKALLSLLERLKEGDVLSSGKHIVISDEAQKTLNVPYDIVARKNNKGKLVFDVIKDKVIGSGASCVVKPVTRTIKLFQSAKTH